MRIAGRRTAVLLCALLLGGCVAGSGSSPNTSTKDPDTPKQACEATIIAGQPKTICY